MQYEVTLRRLTKVGEFKYLGITLTNQTSNKEEINNTLNAGNIFYHSAQNLLSSILLFRNLKIKTWRNLILPLDLYGCESWSLMLREERRLRLCENSVLRRIFGSKRDEVKNLEITT